MELLSTFATSVVLTYTGTGLLPTSVVLIYSKSGALPTSVAPIFTGSGILTTSVAHVWAKVHFCQLQLCLSWLNLRFTNVLVVGLDYIWTWLNWWKFRWDFKRIQPIPDVYLNICLFLRFFGLHIHVIPVGFW